MSKYVKIVPKILSLVLILLLFGQSIAYAFEIIKQGDTGANVTSIQNRLIDLDYYSFKPTGSYGGMTRAGVMYFQQNNSLSADGRVGEETLEMMFSNLIRRNPIPAEVKIPIGPTAKTRPTEFGILADWNERVQAEFTFNVNFTVTDINTGKTFKVQRTGGANHAMVEPSTSADNAVFLEIFGGSFNFSKRPVMLTVGTEKLAASLQGMPTGEDKIPNNGMEGGCAMYFTSSKSDIANLPDEEHRKVLLKATGVQW